MRRGIILFLVTQLQSVLSNECEGQCVTKESCPAFLEEHKAFLSLKKGSLEYNQKLAELRSKVCNSGKKTVCCTRPRQDPLPNSPSWLPTLGESDCGIGYEVASFVIGGNNTSLGEFPWTVLLGKRSRRTGNTFWHCGGTLINRWYVLTAAHCGPRIEMVRIGEWEVKDKLDFLQGTGQVLGNHSDCICRDNFENVPTFCGRNAKNKCAPPPQDIPVADVNTHSGYRQLPTSGIAINDIALVKLKKPVQYNEFAKPVCLPSGRELERVKLFGEPGKKNLLSYGKPMVVGWGQTYTDADDEIEIVSTPIQQKLNLPVVSNKDCGDKYSSLFRKNVGGDIKLEEHLCAGGEKDKDSCKGDSGGPLIGRDGDDQPFQLVGIVSAGTKRCGIGAPGIFTRVTNYIPWIKRNLI